MGADSGGAVTASAWPSEAAAPSPVATSDGSTEHCPALQAFVHQSGSLITTESSRRWSERLWPAEIGAPLVVGQHASNSNVSVDQNDKSSMPQPVGK
jgi:hypothetical protein